MKTQSEITYNTMIDNQFAIVIRIFIIIFTLGCSSITTSSLFAQNKNDESFEVFIEEFCTNPDFQISRIQFPLLFIHFNHDFTKVDTSFVNRRDWKYIRLIYSDEIYKLGVRGQIYDNFNHKLRDTDERVFALHGVNNGVEDFYYFKKINGRWYLVKHEDLST